MPTPDAGPSYFESGPSADALVINERGALWDLRAITDGTNAVDVKAYDGVPANNKLIGHASCSGANKFAAFDCYGVKFTNSLHLVVTGTGGLAGCYFSK